jgi:methylmalonyl-CoA mutase
MSEKLLGDFNQVSRNEWKEKIIADLKGKPYDALLWENEGIKGAPIYTQEDLDSIENLASFQNNGISSHPEIYGSRNWVNYQLILVDNELRANKLALESLNLGADGLVFQLNKPANIDILLKGIQLEHCAVAFELKFDAPLFVDSYIQYIKKENYEFKKVNGFINSSHLPSQKILNAIDQVQNFKCLNIKLSDEFKAVKVVQELALLLHIATSKIVEVQELGMTLDSVLNTIQFQLRLGKNYFIEIAKVRALRMLVQSMWKGFGIDINPSQVMILSSSNDWDEHAEDKHNYLLEATTSAMSAILGGCNALLIRPFYKTFEDQPVLAIRNARNISSILKEESYLDKVTDPSAGSFYIESITNQLIEKAWGLFLKIEKANDLEAINISTLNNLTSDKD